MLRLDDLALFARTAEMVGVHRHDEAKVPGLGELPGLGWLFRKRDQTRRKSELLIFLTPRVIADGRP